MSDDNREPQETEEEIDPNENEYDDDEYEEKLYDPSLPLQVLLFLNVYFSIPWLISTITSLYYQFKLIDWLHQVLSVMSTTLIIPIEGLRLYLGYSGNLQDNIPDFAGFWILSLFLQLPMHLYLTFAPHITSSGFTLAIQIFALALLVLEIVISAPAIRTTSKRRAMRFYYEQMMRRQEKAE